MRRASQPLRHVKLQQLPGFAQPRPRLDTLRRVAALDARPTRLLSVPVPSNIHSFVHVDVSHRNGDEQEHRVETPNVDIPVARSYGKWSGLLFDPARLAAESTFSRKKRVRRLLVDNPRNRNDIALWSCILDYQQRLNGDAGVERVWKAVWARKNLFDTKSTLSTTFWSTIIDAAMRSSDQRFLQDIYVYSEWMNHMEKSQWPKLYTTIIRHFLRTHQHQKALQWHIRLFPSFDPGPDDFLSILREFATDDDLNRSSTLESLYTMSPYRPMYDSMVPFLYNQGKSKLATRWRNLLVAHNDVPRHVATSRPYLRFLEGYFPQLKLAEEEAIFIPKRNGRNEEEDSAGKQALSREMVNRVHGHTFGITVKNYNDNLGARWFATSWVSLDTAISTVAALGIEKIGPLSLQSIALREKDAESFTRRVEHIHSAGVELPDGNFAKLLVHFAEHNPELFVALLRSDFHPDVWDDIPLQRRLLDSDSSMLDLRTHKLLLSAGHFILQQSAKETANTLVEVHFRNRHLTDLLQVLEDMGAMMIGPDKTRANLIFDGLMKAIGLDGRVNSSRTAETVDWYLAVCKQLTRMETPVPIKCWVRFLQYFGKAGRLDDMEELALSIVGLYTKSTSLRPGFIPVHMTDLPKSMRNAFRDVNGIIGAYVPMDLPTQNPRHPLRLIFGPDIISSMVRWTFASTLSRNATSRYSPLRRGMPGFERHHCSRIVKHLRLLKDQGLWVDIAHLARRIIVRLSYLYGHGEAINSRTGRARAVNQIPLSMMKSMIDNAWGAEGLLPPLPELRAQIDKLNLARNKSLERANVKKTSTHVH